MKIKNAEIISSDKRTRIRGGVYIHYTSKENVIKGTKIGVTYEDVTHYFETTDIVIDNDNNLYIKAIEVGYWGTKFERCENFDLRKLINLDVQTISDKEIISKINEMSCWC